MDVQRVLLVEADWRLRRLIRANLEVVGLEVRQAVDGRHALKLLDVEMPDLLLVALDSLGMDALAWFNQLEALFGGSQLPTVVISAEGPDRRLKARSQVASHLSKPFDASVLLEQVESALMRAPPGQAGLFREQNPESRN